MVAVEAWEFSPLIFAADVPVALDELRSSVTDHLRGVVADEVGDTVDVATASWTNTIGAPELATVWRDPDFKPSQRALYYARVIEIPTPRWTAYDQVRFGIKMSKEVPMKHQERAWTSPIWYSPS